MSFNSLIFILFFLPLSLGIYYLLPKKYDLFFLLVVNLLFYFLCDEFLVVLLVTCGLINYLFGNLYTAERPRAILILSIAVNLLFLGFFKYFNFFAGTARDLFGNSFPAPISGLILPMGISFFTFRAISYQVDLYRKKTEPAPGLLSFLVWFTLFPLITAGPIVRYIDMRSQLAVRNTGKDSFFEGLERFALGLIKKTIIAGTFAAIADRTFGTDPGELSTLVAWTGIIAFSFQIFFDFSGYTDMAIGIGKMFGFTFAENFNFPYIAKNIQDFWQRWHMTLSTWLRDYIFLPLAYYISGKMKKERYAGIRTEHFIYGGAILVTFIICGFWHGAGWTYIAWGLWFAVFLMLEQFGLKRLLKRSWPPIRHVYTLLVVVLGWVIFRSESLHQAAVYFTRLFAFTPGDVPRNSYLLFYLLNRETFTILVIAILFSMPVAKWAGITLKPAEGTAGHRHKTLRIIKVAALVVFFVIAMGYVASSSFQPFIYKQF